MYILQRNTHTHAQQAYSSEHIHSFNDWRDQPISGQGFRVVQRGDTALCVQRERGRGKKPMPWNVFEHVFFAPWRGEEKVHASERKIECEKGGPLRGTYPISKIY